MSGTTGHTPAPWTWDNGRLFHSIPEHFASTNVLVVHDPVWLPSEADAHLIAAAPELLEALEVATSAAEIFQSNGEIAALMDFDAWLDKARAAIAKAKGGAK